MKINLLIFLVVFLIFDSHCNLGVDVSQLYSTSVYDCLKKNNFHFAIIRGYCSYGGLDHNINQGLTNAKNAGLQTQMYMFPCRGKSPTSQVDELISGVHSGYSKIWIDVQTNPSPGCSWSGHDGPSNCKFLQQILDRIKSHGKNVGIYASAVMWQSIFGSKGACTSVASHELWYAHYDNEPNFKDFGDFGGWKKPYMKQYQGNANLCGAGIDKNYRE